MGSHYIPVGKIKIDKDILDIVCPAAGYDNTPPPPGIYCPANGYYPFITEYKNPVELPELIEESIICVCNAKIGNWMGASHKYNLYRSGAGLFLYEIFDDSGVLLDSFSSSASSIDFDFPANDRYYVVRISLSSPSYFTGFYNNDGTPKFFNNCVEAIYLNCPSMGSFTATSNVNLQYVEWADDTFNSITSWGYMFLGCVKMQTFKFPEITRSQIGSCMGMFSYSGVKLIDMSECSKLDSMRFSDNIFSNCPYLEKIIMPSKFTGSRFYRLFSNTPRLKEVIMPETFFNDGTYAYDTIMNFMFSDSSVEGEVIINEIPGAPVINITNSFSNASYVKIVRFKGDWSNITSFAIFSNNYWLEIIETPRILNASTSIAGWTASATPSLREYHGPDVGYIPLPSGEKIEIIDGEHDNSGFAVLQQITLNINMRFTLQTFNCPKLRVNRLIVGGAATNYVFEKLTLLDIDFENSFINDMSTIQLRIYANFDTEWIDDLYDRLPTVVGKVADLTQNPGFQSSDKAKIKAKGWSLHDLPVVTTDVVSSIASKTAVCGGEVLESVGANISQRGICRNTTGMPTIADTRTTMSTGIGVFSGTVSGLVANTTYYFRAYATNAYGTSYGEERMFTTLP